MRVRLLLADAVGIFVGTAGAFIFRTGVRSYDSLAPDHLAGLILPAFPLVLTVCVLAFWVAGFYDAERGELEPLEVATSLAWAAALLAFIAFYWAKGPETPFLVMTTGYVLVLTSVLGARSFLRARWSGRVA